MDIELQEEKQSIYERACNSAEKIISIKPPTSLEKNLKDSIEFTRLKITTSGPFSLASIIIVISLVISVILGFLQIVPLSLLLSINAVVIFFGYYIINYPVHLKKIFRIKAGSDIVLSILYMVIAMRSSPNLENAIVFASSNLKGIVGNDLKKLLWDVENRKYDDVAIALRLYSDKWKDENEEYVKAIELLIESLRQDEAERNKILDEAVNVILQGSAERMNKYARELTTPVAAVYMLGIMLPVLGMVLFPMLGVFLGELVNPWYFVVVYNIVLPVFIFWFVTNVLESRPITFSAVDISEHPDVAYADKFLLRIGDKRILLDSLVVALIAEVTIFSVGIILLPLPLTHTLTSVGITSVFVASIAIGVILYSYGKSRNVKKIEDEIQAIETEFTEALFQLGYRINRGVPLEKALDETVGELKGFKIKTLFDKILTNMKNLGLTFERSLYDNTYGALKYYPSRLIKAVMKIISDASNRGTFVAGNAMLVISQYLKGVHSTQEKIDDSLSETTSELNLLGYFLVPLLSGIIVALNQLIINIIIILATKLEEFSSVTGLVGFNPVESIVNLKAATTPEFMQMIVGLYTLELSVIFAYMITGIRRGVNATDTFYTLVRLMSIAMLIYIVTIFVVGSVFGGIVELIAGTVA